MHRHVAEVRIDDPNQRDAGGGIERIIGRRRGSSKRPQISNQVAELLIRQVALAGNKRGAVRAGEQFFKRFRAAVVQEFARDNSSDQCISVSAVVNANRTEK